MFLRMGFLTSNVQILLLEYNRVIFKKKKMILFFRVLGSQQN